MAGGALSETMLMTLCAAASGQLRERLREGVDEQEFKGLFVTAAGMLALSMYCAAEGRERLTSFKAGNLSLTFAQDEEPATAASLRAQAERLLAAYLRDEGFAFLGVRG